MGEYAAMEGSKERGLGELLEEHGEGVGLSSFQRGVSSEGGQPYSNNTPLATAGSTTMRVSDSLRLATHSVACGFARQTARTQVT